MPRTRGRDQTALHYSTSTYPRSKLVFLALLQLSPKELSGHSSCYTFRSYRFSSDQNVSLNLNSLTDGVGLPLSST